MTALARALVASLPSQAEISVGLDPDACDVDADNHTVGAIEELGSVDILNNLLAEVRPGSEVDLVVALMGLAWHCLQRLALALGRPVEQLRAELFTEMAADDAERLTREPPSKDP